MRLLKSALHQIWIFLVLLLILPSDGRKAKRCRYSNVKGPCDPITKTRLVTFTLQQGEDQRCRPTKVKSRSCDPQDLMENSRCRYFRMGQRSPCDINTGTRTILVHLKSGSTSCAPTKTVSKPCKPRRVERRQRKEACKYFRKGLRESCDARTGMRSVVVKLKQGGPSCAPFKAISKPCKTKGRTGRGQGKRKRVGKCKYDRRQASWGPCDGQTGQKTKVMHLATPNPSCPPTKTRTRKCGRKRRKKGQDCVYIRQEWSPCDEQTNTRQREKILTAGDPTVCLPKKVVTKTCRKESRYNKGNWSDCDPASNLKNQTWEPVVGSGPQCQTTVHSKLCSVRAEMTAAKPHKCKYLFSDWSPCDPRSNTMTQIMTLKNGDPNICQRAVKLTKKCKLACKFRRGEWSKCDAQTGLITRVDTLIKGHLEDCDATRQITKKCRTKTCKYSLTAWSECDPLTNHRSRVKRLLKGDEGECKAEEIISKSCVKRDGQARCFFGSFGDFGPCANGVMAKHRPVLQGGVECQRKAVITKACGSSS